MADALADLGAGAVRSGCAPRVARGGRRRRPRCWSVRVAFVGSSSDPLTDRGRCQPRSAAPADLAALVESGTAAGPSSSDGRGRRRRSSRWSTRRGRWSPRARTCAERPSRRRRSGGAASAAPARTSTGRRRGVTVACAVVASDANGRRLVGASSGASSSRSPSRRRSVAGFLADRPAAPARGRRCRPPGSSSGARWRRWTAMRARGRRDLCPRARTGGSRRPAETTRSRAWRATHEPHARPARGGAGRQQRRSCRTRRTSCARRSQRSASTPRSRVAHPGRHQRRRRAGRDRPRRGAAAPARWSRTCCSSPGPTSGRCELPAAPSTSTTWSSTSGAAA